MATGKMNRKQRKELARRLQSANPGLEVVHPRAAGIDVGNGAHYVAVRPDQDPEPGPPVRMLHSGLAPFGGLVKAMWRQDDRDAVHRCLLDSSVRGLRRT